MTRDDLESRFWHLWPKATLAQIDEALTAVDQYVMTELGTMSPAQRRDAIFLSPGTAESDGAVRRGRRGA